jgi:alpha-ketoglutarate-dependent taurine dioxygenase
LCNGFNGETMSAVLPEFKPAAATELELVPLAARIGAEVRGIKLSGELEPAVFASLKRALLRHRVLFVRGQHHLDDAGHEAFGRLWGEIEAHPTVPAPHGTTFLELDSRHGGRADSWHTDVTFRVAPPKIGILRGVVIPPLGGDTVWANAAAAYEGLPAELKTIADGLRALHGNDYDYAENRAADGASEEESAGRQQYRKVFTRTVIEAEHPVVHVHPETGERSLLLGHFAKRLSNLSSGDSRRLFEVLQGHVVRLENTVRWRWTQGDVAIWDNRATQHYAINDYGDQHRVVRRVTVSGEVPTGVDGRRSVDRTAPAH